MSVEFFIITNEIPEGGMTRNQLLYMLKTLRPSAVFADNDTLEVDSGGRLQVRMIPMSKVTGLLAALAVTHGAYDMVLGFAGLLADGDEDAIAVARKVVFREGATVVAVTGANPTGTVELTLTAGAVTLGKLEITDAGVITWNQDAGVTEDVEVEAGEVVRLTGPGTADISLSGLTVTVPLDLIHDTGGGDP